MIDNSKLPHLRVCLTPECNLSCFYCKPGGESSHYSSFRMNIHDIGNILEVARYHGFERVIFTGGEPLLRDDIVSVLEKALGLGFSKVELVTNGYYLSEYVSDPTFRELSLLTVSLDSLNPETFALITRRDCLGRILDGIRCASKAKIALRLNMVLCRLNKDELIDMVDFARTVHAELKIHELLRFRVPDIKLWQDHFVPPSEIVATLEQLSYGEETVFSEEGYGSPLTKFHIKGSPGIIVFDSSKGTRYSDICKSCNLFPCQDGLYALKVTHEGHLKRCWGRDDINLDILTPLRKKDWLTPRNLLDEALDTFRKSWLSSGNTLAASREPVCHIHR